jgi:hypothetical protein
VWYRVGEPPPHELVLRLGAKGQLNAVVGAFRFVHGRMKALSCGRTGDDGFATIGFHAHRDDLVLVGQLDGSQPGRFTLTGLVPDPVETAPGQPLHGGVRSTVDLYLDSQDIWNVELRSGATYRLRLLGKGVRAEMVSPVTGETVSYLNGNDYDLFTPGPSGGGRYVIYVRAPYYEGRTVYSVRVAPAGLDDTGPGRPIPNGVVSGMLDPRGIDVVDLYRFDLPSRSDILLALGRPRPKSVQLVLRRDDGHSIASGQAFRLKLPAGGYAVSVQAPPGTAAVHYRLVLRVHEVSRLSVDTKTAVIGVPVIVTGWIGRPAGAHSTLQIDRYDPVEGWVYLRTYELPVGAGRISSLIWQPPGAGWFRLRVTRPSRSGYVYEHVTAPPVSR